MTHRAKTKATSAAVAKAMFAALAALALTLVLGASTASAKSVVDYFGTDPVAGEGTLGGEFRLPGGVAVNQTGNGAGDRGDVYVVDGGSFNPPSRRNHRIQRFSRDDGSTPAFPYDDTWTFVSAWGADVVQDGGVGDRGDASDANYEICTVVEQCKEGVPSGGNGTAAGNGSLDFPQDIAVDGDTGNVYVLDSGNARVNVYEGDGTFVRSFGWDVVAPGSPGNVPNDEQQVVTLGANTTAGSFGLRVNTGQGIGTFTDPRGNPRSRTITGVSIERGSIQIGDAVSAPNVDFPAGTTVTAVDPLAGTVTLSEGYGLPIGNQQRTEAFTVTEAATGISFDASPATGAQSVQAKLEELPGVSPGDIVVSGADGGPYTLDFGGSLADLDIEGTVGDPTDLEVSGGSPTVDVATAVQGASYEVCENIDGHVCKGGSSGPATGQLGSTEGIAVSAPDSNSATGTVFLADTQNRRVNTYNLDGSAPGSFGSAVNFASGEPTAIAVDSQGIVYAGARQNNSDIKRYDTRNANGGGVGFLAPIPVGVLAGAGWTQALEVDSSTDVLYVLRTNNSPSSNPNNTIQQFGPTNAPGETVPPAAADETHGAGGQVSSVANLAIDEAGGHIYATAQNAAGQSAHGVYVLHEAGPAPTASVDSLSDKTATSITANATIDPNGPPPLSYHFEYSLNGTDWIPLPEVLLGIQEDAQEVDAVISPGSGLRPSTFYHLRLVAAKKFAAPVITDPALTFTTNPAPPIAETAGAPHRTATTAQLNGRVSPRNSATTFRFQYVTQEAFDATGFTDLSSGGQSALVAAGSDDTTRLVGAEITGLDPNTDYRYRLIADNGTPGSSAEGDDMAVRTRPAVEAPLSHGDFPGPPGSDRAWEQVNLPNTGGNPVVSAHAFSEDGNRALYQLGGGTSLSDSGSGASIYYAERGEGSWQTQWITPPREQIAGPSWLAPVFATPDLSSILARNSSGAGATIFGSSDDVWRFGPDAAPENLVALDQPQIFRWFAASEDGTRAVALLSGGLLDSDHAAAAAQANLYDISAGGEPQLVSLLPGERVASCGVDGIGGFVTGGDARSLSADGRYLFFPSRGDDCASPTRLYIRDLDAQQTKLISGPSLSGRACGAGFIKSIPGAAFFWTQNQLDPDDTEPTACQTEGAGSGALDGDIYRYDTTTEEVECLTCLGPGFDGDVTVDFERSAGRGADDQVAVSEDGSRLYFNSLSSLLPGVPVDSLSTHAYRLEVAGADLAYVGPIGNPGGVLSLDGTQLLFTSNEAGLNPLGDGADNGGTSQWYRYDDTDRSLVCISCPLDGSEPAGGVISGGGDSARNTDPLAGDGTFAFSTPTALVDADQNSPGPGADPTAGADIYEWRDGRQILVSDGLTEWLPASPPIVRGVSPSGRDVYFTAPAQLTPDALDGYQRLYTARIGGGFEFPEPDPPCPLEVCQGTPRGAPEDPVPSSESFSGRGNPAPEAQSCTPATRQAKRLSKQAAGLRKKAARISKKNPQRAKALRTKARLKARSAKQKSRAARSCRRANREATR